MTTAIARHLKWITPRTNPRAMAGVAAKANINTLYNIERNPNFTLTDGVLREHTTWSLTARREGNSEWLDLGTFKTLKAAKVAANADCGVA